MLMRVGAVFLVAAARGAGACGGTESPELADIEIRGHSGPVVLTVEVADTSAERARGLMGRTELAEDRGMLFVNDGDVITSFHMEDTLILLSLAFIDADGTIVSLVDMDPCLSETCPDYEPPQAYRFGLEVNQGAIERWGVSVGDVAVLPE